jgi:uncharacterized protein (TIGR00661 family)
MKILYAVQATGNGHISRAHQVLPYLEEYGEVDIFLSGSNSTLSLDLPVKYRSKGLSLFYSQCGDLDYWKTFRSIRYLDVIKEARALPVEKYDVVLNDFEHITSRACRIKKVPSFQFGHQASFKSKNTPRPDKKNWLGEYVLHNYAPAKKYVGLHFEPYDDFIFSPVIKKEFLDIKPVDQGHLTVYLPAYDKICVEKILKEIKPMQVHWFVPHINAPYKDENIHFFPVQQKYFNESLIHCHALLTGGGFETPAEALYLEKKLMVIPIEGQYEQQCNAAALQKKGVKKLSVLNEDTKGEFFTWLKKPKTDVPIQANNIKETLDWLFNQSAHQ